MKYFLFSLIILLLFVPVASAFPLNASDIAIAKALDYLNNSQQSNGGFNDSPSSYYTDLTPFAIMAIKAANQSPYNWTKNGTSPVSFIKEMSVPSLNSSALPTHYSVVILALVAVGENPHNISNRSLVNELTAKQNSDGSFNGSVWVTDQEWAILALAAAGYKNTPILQNATDYLVSQQKSDGGFGAWCPDAASSCPDETSLGIMALSASGYSNSTVINNAKARVKQFQSGDGGINPGWGSNADSDSWAVQAIASIGSNFTEWARSNFTINATSNHQTSILSSLSLNISIVNHGNNYPFTHLISLQDNDTGGFNYFKPIQDTSYAILALLGKPFPINFYNQTNAEIHYNQTFNVSLNQTRGWEWAINNNSLVLGVDSINISLNLSIPSNSTGEQDNVTITVLSLSDGLNKSKTVTVSVEKLCGNNVCETGETCSICSADCGGCSGGSSGGGGSGGGSPYSTYLLGKLEEGSEVKRVLGKGDKVKFTLGNEEHFINILQVTPENARIEINSSLFNFILGVNESRKFNLTSYGYYDLFVRINKIINSKADLSIMEIHETILLPFEVMKNESEEVGEAAEEPLRKESEEIKTNKITGLAILQYKGYTPIILFIILAAVIIFVCTRRLNKR